MFYFFKDNVINSDKIFCYGYDKLDGVIYPSKELFSPAIVYASMVDSTITGKIQNAEVSLPKNYEQLLVDHYGQSWKTPDPSWSNSMNPNKVRIEDTYGRQVLFNSYSGKQA